MKEFLKILINCSKYLDTDKMDDHGNSNLLIHAATDSSAILEETKLILIKKR